MKTTLPKIARDNLRTGVSAYMRKLYKTEQPRVESLRFCKADVLFYSNGDIVLRSYATMVCVYIASFHTLYIVDNYSATTSQHIAKFIHDYEMSNVVYCYDRSDKMFICTTRVTSKYYPKTEKHIIMEPFANTGYLLEMQRINALIGQRV